MQVAWPEPDPAALQQDEIEYVVQVNGKLRGTVWVPASSTEEHTATLAITAVEKFIAGKPVRKRIVVPGRLVNIVV